MDSYKKKGLFINGYKILGSETDLPYVVETYGIEGIFIAIGDNWIRKILADRISKIVPGLSFISVIHPTASIGKDVQIGKGTVVMPGTIVNANAVIKDFCILNTNATLGHDGYMDSFSSLSPGVITGGNLWLGRCSVLALGAKVIENITIGRHSVIGAGSLVVDNIPEYVMAYGSPSQIISRRTEGDSYLAGRKRTSSRLFITHDF